MLLDHLESEYIKLSSAFVGERYAYRLILRGGLCNINYSTMKYTIQITITKNLKSRRMRTNWKSTYDQ